MRKIVRHAEKWAENVEAYMEENIQIQMTNSKTDKQRFNLNVVFVLVFLLFLF